MQIQKNNIFISSFLFCLVYYEDADKISVNY